MIRAVLVCFWMLTVVAIAAPLTAPRAADFTTWLGELKREARAKGIDQATLDAALGDISPIPRVIELDRRQPEFSLTFDQYMSRVVSDARIKKGRALMAKHRALLTRIGDKYGVQPRFIVALWGIETDFGRIDGGFPVIASLSTLAFDGRRAAYFRKELFNALTILQQGHITPAAMKGSWAGAMGQNQFMPSSFLNFAVDENGDGRRDIWRTTEDVFGSSANYLSKVGWRADQTWGREVRLPPNFDENLIGLETRKRLPDWQALGVRRADGRDLPTRPLRASLVQPPRHKKPVFLAYDNYRAILRWNRAHLFAIAVGRLADRIGAR